MFLKFKLFLFEYYIFKSIGRSGGSSSMRSGLSSGNGYDSVFSRRSPPPRSGNGMSRFRLVNIFKMIRLIGFNYFTVLPFSVHMKTSAVILSMIDVSVVIRLTIVVQECAALHLPIVMHHTEKICIVVKANKKTIPSQLFTWVDEMSFF